MLEKLGIFFLGLFLFLMFGRPADFYFPNLHLPLISSLTGMLIAVLLGGLVRIFRSQLGLLMTMLAVWFVITIPFSTYRGGSFAIITSEWMRSYLCFVLIVAVCDSPRQVRLIVHVLAWSLLLASIFGLVYGIAPFGRLQLPTGLLSGPNELAGAMIVGILYWLSILFDPDCSKIYRGLSAAAILPMMLVLLRTGSRGGMLSLSIVMTVMFFRLPAGKKLAVSISALVLIVLAMATLPDELRKRFTTYFSGDEEVSQDLIDNPTGSTDSRLYLLRRSLEFTVTHPIFGVGPDQFATYEDKVQRDAGRRKGSWLGSHNTYTQISSETGLPGALIFIYLLFTAWRSTAAIQRQSLRMQTAYSLSVANTAMTLRMVLLAYLIFFFFEHTAYMPFWPTLIALVAALKNGFDADMSLAGGAQPRQAPAPVRPNAFWRPGLPGRT